MGFRKNIVIDGLDGDKSFLYQSSFYRSFSSFSVVMTSMSLIILRYYTGTSITGNISMCQHLLPLTANVSVCKSPIGILSFTSKPLFSNLLDCLSFIDTVCNNFMIPKESRWTMPLPLSLSSPFTEFFFSFDTFFSSTKHLKYVTFFEMVVSETFQYANIYNKHNR